MTVRRERFLRHPQKAGSTLEAGMLGSLLRHPGSFLFQFVDYPALRYLNVLLATDAWST